MSLQPLIGHFGFVGGCPIVREGPDAIALLQSLVDGGGALNGTSSRQSESSSQKTLTVIIKFDEDGLVRDYAYHTSRF